MLIEIQRQLMKLIRDNKLHLHANQENYLAEGRKETQLSFYFLYFNMYKGKKTDLIYLSGLTISLIKPRKVQPILRKKDTVRLVDLIMIKAFRPRNSHVQWQLVHDLVLNLLQNLDGSNTKN